MFIIREIRIYDEVDRRATLVYFRSLVIISVTSDQYEEQVSLVSKNAVCNSMVFSGIEEEAIGYSHDPTRMFFEHILLNTFVINKRRIEKEIVRSLNRQLTLRR